MYCILICSDKLSNSSLVSPYLISLGLFSARRLLNPHWSHRELGGMSTLSVPSMSRVVLSLSAGLEEMLKLVFRFLAY